MERLCNGVRDIVSVAHEIVVLRHGERDPCDVDLLECILAKQCGGDIAGDHHHRHGVEHRRADPRHQVGRPWPRRSEADADAPGCTGVSIGGVRRSLLVADKDVAQARMVGENIVERQDDAAWVAPDHINTLQEERLTEHIGADAWARTVARTDATVAQHLLARALRRICGWAPCTWHVSHLCHRSTLPCFACLLLWSIKNPRLLGGGPEFPVGAVLPPSGLLSPAGAE